MFDGRVWAARPLHLLSVDDSMLVAHLAQGSTWLCPKRLDGSPHRVPEDPWTLLSGPWPHDNLWFVPHGAPFAVHTIRPGPDADLLGWYVNVQEPIRATAAGFDYLDHTLDVIVTPDLSACELKDEDELAVGRERGLYTADEAERIRAAADAGVAWLRTHHDELQRWADERQIPRATLHLDDAAELRR
jgi:hypothetical protein